MKRTFTTLSALLLSSIAVPALAQDARVAADLNMRAGPGTQYPVITTIPGGRAVDIYGCVSSLNWCDVSWRGNRGWVYSDYLNYTYDRRTRPVAEWRGNVGLPIVSFSFGDYADRHYRGMPWYADRGRWDNDRRHDRNDRRDRWDDDDRRDRDGRPDRWDDDDRRRHDARGGRWDDDDRRGGRWDDDDRRGGDARGGGRRDDDDRRGRDARGGGRDDDDRGGRGNDRAGRGDDGRDGDRAERRERGGGDRGDRGGRNRGDNAAPWDRGNRTDG